MHRLAIVLALVALPGSGMLPDATFGQEPGVAAARQATMNNMKMLGVALQNYHDTYKTFPPPAILSTDGKPLLSWRVKILQFIDQDLYNEFHMDEPWNSEHNKELIPRMPDVFQCPLSKVGGEHRTIFVVPRGASTMFAGPDGAKIRAIVDGTSKTIDLVEVNDKHAVIWTRPDDWMFNLANPTAGLGGHFEGIFLAGAADASVHEIPLTIEPDTLKALLSYNGREAISFPDQ